MCVWFSNSIYNFGDFDLRQNMVSKATTVTKMVARMIPYPTNQSWAAPPALIPRAMFNAAKKRVNLPNQ